MQIFYLKFNQVLENIQNFFMKLKKLDPAPIENINLSSLYKLDTKIEKYSDKIEIKVIAESDSSFINTNIFFTYTLWITSC